MAVFSLVIIWFYVSNTYVLPWEKKEVIQTTLEWGGLNDLPNEIQNLKLDKKGSMFTRQFIIEFEVDDSNKISDWIKKSKRLKNNIPKLKGNTKIYEIYPGENDSYGGRVEIEGKKVKIDMSWS
ncbi:hypothetical protein [Winogradskyella alexanderae]|uniref:Uncharacterized protein n=1 Tax=Winogradskyella alexanderae TaxID=2877123 RepID=A0ABS7XWJ6_9FLAO|nr:hypothetical protein [Winogradskyella alexanderae]MCA0133764.1 hypothetical protein [Winogradskyella alexanderae]